MRTLAFDGRMGASGDMILAALIAAGADPAALDPVESALNVRYEVGETEKNGIAATTVEVVLTGRGTDEAANAAEVNDDEAANAAEVNDDEAANAGEVDTDEATNAGEVDTDEATNAAEVDTDEAANAAEVNDEPAEETVQRNDGRDPHRSADHPHRRGPDRHPERRDDSTPPDSDADSGAGGEGRQHDHHGHEHGEDRRRERDHHAHGHHGHEHDRGDGDTPAEGHGPHRTYGEVVEIVESMGLPPSVEADAIGAFELLGEAEAAVHGTDLEGTHFHEVGADDAIADVTGACLLLDDLDPGRVVTTPLSAGGGEVSMSHGRYPVPTPAVVEIAERADWSLASGPVEAELLTPTGAAILARVAAGVDRLPTLRVRDSGYGAGGYDFPERPNVLRALVGDGEGALTRDEIAVLETNLDDASPEVLGGLQETLLSAGARDVTILPATMKKSRPGHLVKVVVKPEHVDRVARRLAEETGTLGVREHGAGHRWIADRRFETATVAVGDESYDVAVKVASDAAGEVYDVSAEYDAAAAVADETELPVREVLRRAEAAVRESIEVAEGDATGNGLER